MRSVNTIFQFSASKSVMNIRLIILVAASTLLSSTEADIASVQSVDNKTYPDNYTQRARRLMPYETFSSLRAIEEKPDIEEAVRLETANSVKQGVDNDESVEQTHALTYMSGDLVKEFGDRPLENKVGIVNSIMAAVRHKRLDQYLKEAEIKFRNKFGKRKELNLKDAEEASRNKFGKRKGLNLEDAEKAFRNKFESVWADEIIGVFEKADKIRDDVELDELIESWGTKYTGEPYEKMYKEPYFRNRYSYVLDKFFAYHNRVWQNTSDGKMVNDMFKGIDKYVNNKPKMSSNFGIVRATTTLQKSWSEIGLAVEDVNNVLPHIPTINKEYILLLETYKIKLINKLANELEAALRSFDADNKDVNGEQSLFSEWYVKYKKHKSFDDVINLDRIQEKDKERIESYKRYKEELDRFKEDKSPNIVAGINEMDDLAKAKFELSGDAYREEENKIFKDWLRNESTFIDINKALKDTPKIVQDKYGSIFGTFIKWQTLKQETSEEVKKDIKKYSSFWTWKWKSTKRNILAKWNLRSKDDIVYRDVVSEALLLPENKKIMKKYRSRYPSPNSR